MKMSIAEKKLLSNQRRILKANIYKERVKWGESGYEPTCAICGQPPKNGALEMHESLITREDVRGGGKELIYDIMIKHNCVLVHADCHVFANTEMGKKNCIKNILEYNKYEDVKAWLKCLDARMKSNTAKVSLQLVKEVYDEVQSL